MKIQRIDSYSNNLFKKEILNQHGAYLIDEKYPCEFLITSSDSAIIYYHNYNNINALKEIAEEFRFYSKNITKFFDNNNNLLFKYKPIELFEIEIMKLQPSQFYVNMQKIDAIKTWAENIDNFIIPIADIDNQKVILDGHTRLYLASMLGYKKVLAFYDDADECIKYFGNEAKKRNILKITDLKAVDENDYIKLWHKFCDDYFTKK